MQTLWLPEMYELPGGAPIRRSLGGGVYDCAGQQIVLMGASGPVLRELATDPKWRDTKVRGQARLGRHVRGQVRWQGGI